MMTARVYQDIILPLSSLEAALARAADLFEIWPILVYPCRIYADADTDDHRNINGQFRRPARSELVVGSGGGDGEAVRPYAMYFDLGVYGIPKAVREGRAYESVRRPTPSHDRAT